MLRKYEMWGKITEPKLLVALSASCEDMSQSMALRQFSSRHARHNCRRKYVKAKKLQQQIASRIALSEVTESDMEEYASDNKGHMQRKQKGGQCKKCFLVNGIIILLGLNSLHEKLFCKNFWTTIWGRSLFLYPERSVCIQFAHKCSYWSLIIQYKQSICCLAKWSANSSRRWIETIASDISSLRWVA